MVRKVKGVKIPSELEETLALQLRAAKIEFVRGYKFHPDRKWEFDFAIPELKIAIECEGGVWTQGRHTRGQGYINDMEKYNAGMLLGWDIARFPLCKIKSGQALETIENFIYLKKYNPPRITVRVD